MTDSVGLERGYRRWLRLYPTSFRREHEAEILAVLMAGAEEERRRPGPMECLDLMRGALLTRLRPRVPRSERAAFTAVRLLYLGAVVELAAAIALVATMGEVRSNVVKSSPGLTAEEWHAIVVSRLGPNEAGAVIGVGFWLWTAWSVGRGHRRARIPFAAFVALNMLGLLNGLVHGSAVYARSDLAIGITLCLVALAAAAAVFRVKTAGPRSGTGRTSAGP